MTADKITIEWPDGVVGVFTRQPNGSWHHRVDGMRITGYDPPDVMRVLSTATGTTEVGA